MNKPVAWIDSFGDLEKFNHQNNKSWIPLYDHPVKELTDEEIKEIWKMSGYDNLTFTQSDLYFAKAILRKAQEK